MSSPVIQVENLSKLYRLGEVSTGTISHDLNRWWHRVRGREDPYAKIGQVNDRTRKKADGEKAETLKSAPISASPPSDISAFQHSSFSAFNSDYVYALKDINFTVNQGEVLGIIGRNGAGKSTLLKILSRVTAPTSGRIKVKGRIASLLEVGTGFHPELTGRENIFLNGAILGMRKHEITRKLDEIVDFSGCAAYLDTPVKRYSSGMYVRLAFAVAAHLESEIMVIDEVLAVGDAEFQSKCIGKMKGVSQAGRTVLFVSHNLAAVQALTTSAIVLGKGGLEFAGETPQAVSAYLNQSRPSSGNAPCLIAGVGKHATILRVAVLDRDTNLPKLNHKSRSLVMEVDVRVDGQPDLSLEIFLKDPNGQRLGLFSLRQFHGSGLPRIPGTYRVLLHFDDLLLASGHYSFDITTSVANVKWDHYVVDAGSFDVLFSDPGETGWNFRFDMGFGVVSLVPSLHETREL